MELQEAIEVLNGAVRSECRDHAFGDREVFWEKEGVTIAEGYFGSGEASVWFDGGDHTGSFSGEDARKLGECGATGAISRNDETGPDTYTEGDVMPGLSVGDVYHELTGSYLDES